MSEENNNEELRPSKMRGVAFPKAKYGAILAIIVIIVVNLIFYKEDIVSFFKWEIIKHMSKNLFKIAKQKKIKYFLISFVDLFGVLRSKLVPVRAIKKCKLLGQALLALLHGLIWHQQMICLVFLPRKSNSITLEQRSWLVSIWSLDERKTSWGFPRVMLKKQIKELAKQGLTMKSEGMWVFFNFFRWKGHSRSRDTQSKPTYDQSSLMRRYELIKEICDCMIEMGWGPYQNDHEDVIIRNELGLF